MLPDRSSRRSNDGWLTRDGGHTFFEGSTEGRRRSVVFAIAIATGSLATAGATSALVAATAYWPIVLVLALVAVGAYAFGALVALGRWPFLFADHQLLWRH